MSGQVRLPSLRRVTITYCLMQVGLWAALSSFCGFQSSILLERGFSSAQAGIFAALSYLAGLLVQPIIGGWADRHPEIPLKRIYGGCLVLALAIHAVFFFSRPGFAGTAVIFFAVGILETNSYPLVDAMAMQYVNAGMNLPYSLGRGMGSVGYALVGVAVGRLTARFGLEAALIFHAGLLLAMLVIIASFPTFPSSAAKEERPQVKPHSVWYLLRSNPSFALMLGAGFFGMAAVLPLTNFLITLVTDRGGDSGDLGLAIFLMAVFELPAAYVFQKLYRRVGSQKVLVISLLFMTAKPLLFMATRSLAVLLALQPIQMFGYGLFTPANVYFANESVEPEDRVRGQTMKTALTNSLGGVVGNLTAGYIIDWGGVNALLTVCTLSGAVGVALALLSVRVRRRAAIGRGC